MSEFTSAAACRSMRRPKARWFRFNRCSAASGGHTSCLAVACGRPHEKQYFNHPAGDTMTNVQSVIQLFSRLLEAATGVRLGAAALFLAWGGFLYMTAGGSPRRMESARGAAFAAIGGLAGVLLARTSAELVQNAIPVSGH